MARPSTLPRWATGGGAAVTEPTSGEKDVGWVDNDPAPAGWMNWLQEKTYEWLQFVDLRARLTAISNWRVSSETFDELNDVAFDASAGHWVAVGDSDGVRAEVQISIDRQDWSVVTSGLSAASSLKSVAYSPQDSRLIAVGSSDGTRPYVVTSTDGGLTWTQLTTVPSLALRLDAIGYEPTNEVWVAVGESTGTEPLILVSEDHGATWAQRTGVGGNLDLLDVMYDAPNGMWLAAGGDDGVSPLLMTSSDVTATTWVVNATLPAGAEHLTSVTSDSVTGNIVTAGKANTAGVPALVFVSDDAGATWSTITDGLLDGYGIYTLHEADGLLVAGAAGFAGIEAIYSSSDGGLTWAFREFDIDIRHSGGLITGLEEYDGLWVAVGRASTSGYVFTSLAMPEA